MTQEPAGKNPLYVTHQKQSVSMQEINPTLILVGGSVRAAATDAVAGGYRVVAIDRFGDRDLLQISERWYPLDDRWQQQLAAWPAAPIVGTGGFLWRDSCHLRSDRLVAFPTPDVFQSLCDPEQLRQVAAGCELDFPLTIPHAGRSSPLMVAAPASASQRWLIKPRYGTAGIGIRFASASSLSGHTDPSDDPIDLQQWVAGRPLGACFFTRRRCGQRVTRLLGAFDGLTHRQHRDWRWLYGGSLGPRQLTTSDRESLSRLGTEIADRFGLVGLFNVDLLRRRNGTLVLLEVNPRYSASMELLRIPLNHSQAYPWASLIDWHLAAYEESAGQIDHQTADRRTAWAGLPADDADVRSRPAAHPAAGHGRQAAPESACKRIVYAATSMRIDCSVEELICRFAAPVEKSFGVQISFHDLPPLGAIVPAGAPALSVIVRGRQDAATLRRTAQRIAAHLRRDLRAP